MNEITMRQPSIWHTRRRRLANRLMWILAVLAAVLALIPLGLVLYHVVVNGLPALNWDFFTKAQKPPGEPGGGMVQGIIGTLIINGMACIVGLPIGILGGIFLAEFGNNRIGGVIRFCADVLASVPSIVMGVLFWTLVVQPQHHYSGLAGGLVLGVMMTPVIMRTTEELVRLVPKSQREAALSLGATHFTTVFTVVIAAARAGVITGVLLAVARIAGETAPLLFTTLGNSRVSTDPSQPMSALPLEIFSHANSPYTDWNQQAWAGSLVLVTLILLLNIGARVATRGRIRTVR